MFDINLLPEKVKSITPYAVDKNQYKIRLDANESFISFPEEERNKIQNALNDINLNRYPDCEAQRLCSAFADFYGISAKNVIAGNGSDEIISLIMTCFCEKGQKVAVFSPDFSMYGFYATLAEQEVITIKKGNELHIDFNTAQEVISKEKPRIVIFSNPCNPTGILESKENIKNLLLNNPQTIFISDEAYMDFADNTKKDSFLYETEKYTNLLVLKTLSKAFGCAALRVGFLVGDEISRQSFFKIKSPYNLNSLSQEFASAVLEDKSYALSRTKTIKKSKEFLQAELQKLESETFLVIPSQANFVTVKTKYAKEIYQALLRKSISIRCFDFHGGALRITAGTKQETETLIKELKAEVEKING